MILLQQPDAFSFVAGMKDIIISSQVAVKFVFATTSETVFQEIYYPDAENKIHIRTLGKLCKSYISPITLRERFLMTLSPVDESHEAEIIDITVQYGNVELDVTATEFLQKRFLTLLDYEKIIYRQQKEFLSLVVFGATEVKAMIRRFDGTTETIVLYAFSATDVVITLDVSLSKFTSPETVAYYTIVAGERAMTYYPRRESIQGDYVQLLFLNSFGVKETCIPSGLINRENKYTNSFGTFSGKYKKYNAELNPQYTAHTGIMDNNHARWIEDLFLSQDIFLLSNSGIEMEVTIEEATVKRSSAREELPAFEFKYRPAKVGLYEYTTKRSRIFDDTFDYIYN